jgi:hypothetical protein
MRAATIFLGLALGMEAETALAQTSLEVTEKLRTCWLLASQQRIECLDKLLQDFGESGEGASSTMSASPVAGSWIVSETVSPIDYTPVIVATARSKVASNASPMHVSIQCRSGRTDVVLSGAALTRPAEEYRVSYRVDDGQTTGLTTGSASSGVGVAVKGDAVRLLHSLPDGSTIAFSIAVPSGPVLEGRYAMPALKAVLNRLASPCKWPAVFGRK